MQVLPKRAAQELSLEHTCLRDGIIKSKPDLNIFYVPEAFQLKRKAFGEDYIFRVPEAKAVKGEIRIPYEEMKAAKGKFIIRIFMPLFLTEQFFVLVE